MPRHLRTPPHGRNRAEVSRPLWHSSPAPLTSGCMNRRQFTALTLAGLATPGLARAASLIPLPEIAAYLRGLDLVQARFTQRNADGSTSTGTLYLRRPGRARFEYDPPAEVLVMVGGGTVAIFDAKGDPTPESYPLRRTPLNVILSREVDLEGSDAIFGHQLDGDLTTVLAHDPAHPEYGRIALQFAADPVRLARWVIVGETGEQTVIELGPLTRPAQLSSNLFNIPGETNRRRN
ncbi:outer membrane lipoprotein carrier protein [Dinoroseobacter shibae DFL 12 = DSM 16493]|uniref:Outer membrane lipoprotein carrier protein n=2 Tax=Roseobacteraceae TaxID=2854170 RepID=A8LJY1_DINSH|nr:outer membrane lipoprotein carrier protein [Dinoroseobacter shibae DFL 12 = DSM 16493]